MFATVFFEHIILEVPRTRIYRRLGYRRGVTEITDKRAAEVEKYISEALNLIRLRGTGRRLPLQDKNEAQIVLGGGTGDEVLQSRRLSRFFGECQEAVLMGATAGHEIMAAIAEDTDGGHLTRGVVLDATASEMVDAALDWIMSYFARVLRRERKALTEKRFSAGYGDFQLENQQTMFRLLELERIEVQITETFLLVPEKSVTALAGVKGFD